MMHQWVVFEIGFPDDEEGLGQIFLKKLWLKCSLNQMKTIFYRSKLFHECQAQETWIKTIPNIPNCPKPVIKRKLSKAVREI